MNIHPDVTKISHVFGGSKVELYVIRSNNIALIDTGTAMAPINDIVPALGELGLKLADIDLILNTHGHFDHTGGNSVIKSMSDAQILIHESDVGYLQDHEHCFEKEMAPLIKAIMGQEYGENEKANYLQMAGPDIIVDKQLKNNDVIDMGRCRLRVIHLPGHSPGSVGFYWEDEGILFSGDFPSGLQTGDGSLPVISDLTAYQSSIKLLMEMPIRYMLQGHEYRGLTLSPSPVKQHKEIKQYLQDSLTVAQWLEETIKNTTPLYNGENLIEITDKIINTLPEKAGFKPVRQLPVPLLSITTVFSALHASR